MASSKYLRHRKDNRRYHSPIRGEMERLKQYWVAVILSLTLFLAVIVPVYYTSTKVETVVCSVNYKRVVSNHGNLDYEVFTSCGPMSIKGNPLDGNIDPSAMFNQINAGETYTFVIRGSWVPILDSYPTIINVRK